MNNNIKAHIIYTFKQYEQEGIKLKINLNKIKEMTEIEFISKLIQDSFNDYEKYLFNDLKKMSICFSFKNDDILKKFPIVYKVIKKMGKYYFNQKDSDKIEKDILLHASAFKFF